MYVTVMVLPPSTQEQENGKYIPSEFTREGKASKIMGESFQFFPPLLHFTTWLMYKGI